MKKMIVFLSCALLLGACTSVPEQVKDANAVVTKLVDDMPAEIPSIDIPNGEDIDDPTTEHDKAPVVDVTDNPDPGNTGGFDYSIVPEYSGEPYVEINNNVPYPMGNWEIGTEHYSPLDELGRCGVAYACVGEETMPAYGEERGNISMVKPSGWQNKMYPGLVDGDHVYHRAHILAWCLCAENNTVENLITGCAYMNELGMLPQELKVAEYIYATKNHVLYRVTPVFLEDELLCRGVLMEAKSVEDDEISFCVWCYNVQPGIVIDYSDGNSYIDGILEAEQDYVLNTKSHKVHKPECDSVKDISDKNRKDYHGKAEDLIQEGYEPCKACNPW